MNSNLFHGNIYFPICRPTGQCSPQEQTEWCKLGANPRYQTTVVSKHVVTDEAKQELKQNAFQLIFFKGNYFDITHIAILNTFPLSNRLQCNIWVDHRAQKR